MTTLGPTRAANPQSEIRNPQSIERFAHDVRTVLGSFGWDESMSWPILVLSDGGEALNRIVEALNAAGMPAKVSLPEPRNLKLPAGFQTQDIYDVSHPAGAVTDRPGETSAGRSTSSSGSWRSRSRRRRRRRGGAVLVAGAVTVAACSSPCS